MLARLVAPAVGVAKGPDEALNQVDLLHEERHHFRQRTPQVGHVLWPAFPRSFLELSLGDHAVAEDASKPNHEGVCDVRVDLFT